MIVEEFTPIAMSFCNIEQASRNDEEFDGITKYFPSGQRYMLKLFFDTTIKNMRLGNLISECSRLITPQKLRNFICLIMFPFSFYLLSDIDKNSRTSD